MLTGLSPPGAGPRLGLSPPVPPEIDSLIRTVPGRRPCPPPAVRPRGGGGPARAETCSKALIAAGETPPPEIVAAAGNGRRPAGPRRHGRASRSCRSRSRSRCASSGTRHSSARSRCPRRPPSSPSARGRRWAGSATPSRPWTSPTVSRTTRASSPPWRRATANASGTALSTGRPVRPSSSGTGQAHEPLLPRNALGSVTPLAIRRPPRRAPRASGLDTLGRLVGLEVGPSPTGGEPPPRPLDWGAPPGGRRPRPHASRGAASRTADPPLYADARAAWEGTAPEPPHLPLRIEAAALRGRPVWLATCSVDRAGEGPPTERRSLRRGGVLGLGRPRGSGWSCRSACCSPSATSASDVVTGRGRSGWPSSSSPPSACPGCSRRPSPSARFAGSCSVARAAGYALWLAAWRPRSSTLPASRALRRRWPELLISWSRLLAGRWRDPRVGRDMLLGLVSDVRLDCPGRGRPSRLVAAQGGPPPRLLLPTDVAMLGGLVPSLAVGPHRSGPLRLASVLSVDGDRSWCSCSSSASWLLVVLAMIPLCYRLLDLLRRHHCG